jgi:putative membrane protein
MAAHTKHRRYLFILTVVFSVLWLLLAIDPVDRKDWALENVLVLAFGIGMAASHRQFVFSRVSYTLIFVFMCMHTVGAHYTYSLVPYDTAWREFTGDTFNQLVGWERNNYDRVVHFCYGLLLAYPLRELFLRIADVRGFWGYFLPYDFAVSTSATFEVFEWVAAAIFGGPLGAAYLGHQGDIWDAQKDMVLAAAGALIAMLITASINLRLQRDFGREWADSLKIKGKAPHGEEAINRMKKDSRRQ